MNKTYEEKLNDLRNASKEDLMKYVSRVEQESFIHMDSLNLSDDVKREVILMIKGRSYVERMLVNALAKSGT